MGRLDDWTSGRMIVDKLLQVEVEVRVKVIENSAMVQRSSDGRKVTGVKGRN